ncbi:hypothetical protein NEOLEDRAFT_691090 [Neolentinus lepideus HHB14362 ss-1]|uniref:PH domain-containing protein n=1 Tax=Neolentinus lepideus HHB14362 ss-1 TaxID=1314782 RepID=A0A165V1E7_9AGAM|nr:hypothetical protein NEOLEDRAFT_691090 [Neolentinus lepideus HHB14362 ss-1]
MPDPTDSPSIYSLYSRPMTRNTSSVESDYLTTPSAESPLRSASEGHSPLDSEPAKPHGLGLQHVLPTVVETRDELESGEEVVSNSPQYWQRQQEEGAPLHPRKSTKELVRRFESMTSETDTRSRRSCDPVSNTVSRSVQDKVLPKLPPPALQSRDGKSRSPLRQSFRNLISVFKKSKSISRDKVELGGSFLLQYPGVRQERSYSSAPGRPIMPYSTTMANSMSTCPSQLMTGSVLYLSRPSTDSRSRRLLAVWSSCTATLFPAHITLTSFTAQNNPLSRTVSLVGCTDVRSINLNELEESDRSMLPSGSVVNDGTREPRVFELSFDGSRKEIFASPSVKERAAWVSAIWDAILNTQDQKSARLDLSNGRSRSAEYSSPYASESHIIPLQGALDTELQGLSRAPSLDRSLPPTPVCMTPIDRVCVSSRNLQLDNQSKDSTIRPSRIQLSAPDRTRPASPSIRNLDRRSMVTKRLAQLEGINPESGTPPAQLRFNDIKRPVTRGIICTQPGWESRSAGSTADRPLVEQVDPALTSWTDVEARMSCAPSVGEDRVVITRSRDDALPGLLKGPHPNSLSQLSGADSGAHRFNAGSMSEVKEMLQAILRELRGTQEGATIRGESRLYEIRSTLEEFTNQLRRYFEESMKQNMDQLTVQSSAVVESVDGLHTDVKSGWIRVLEGLDQLQRYGCEGNSALEEKMQLQAEGTTAAVTKLNSKIDDFLLANRSAVVTVDRCGPESRTEVSPAPESSLKEVAECLRLLREGNANQAVYLDNQADGVRYLNELNSWLETFVNHGVSQIQTVMEDVKALRTDLSRSVDAGSRQSLGEVGSIQRLLQESQSQQRENARLLSSVQLALQDLREAASSTNASSLAALLEQQRVQQERLIQTLADGLSQDIRGQRLKFVEAMKEATTINVQSHVSQFRNELTKEVLRMTQTEAASQYRAKHTYNDFRKPAVQSIEQLDHSQRSFVPSVGSRSSFGLSDGGPRPIPSHYVRRW